MYGSWHGSVGSPPAAPGPNWNAAVPELESPSGLDITTPASASLPVAMAVTVAGEPKGFRTQLQRSALRPLMIRLGPVTELGRDQLAVPDEADLT